MAICKDWQMRWVVAIAVGVALSGARVRTTRRGR